MKKLILLSATILFLQSNMLAQAPDTLWTKTFRGKGSAEGNSVQQTSDGGYIVAGSTTSLDTISPDIYLIKTNSIGDTQWTKTYGGIADEWGYRSWDEGKSVQQTSDGGYIIAGSSGDPLFNPDVYLIKTDSSGDTLWTKTFGGNHWDICNSVQQTSDGGYIVAGFTQSFGAGYTDVHLIKTNSLGDTLWTKTFGGAYEDGGSSVQQTSDGGYIVAGFTLSFATNGQNVYLIKTDSSGDTLWTKTYGGSNCWDRGNSVQQTRDGGYIITGNKGPMYNDDNPDIYLIKTDSLGDTLWTKTFGGIDYEEGYSVQQTSDGGYIIAGISWDSGFNSDIYLIKTDPSGNTLWIKTFGGIRYYMRCSIQQTSDGGYIVAGSKIPSGSGDSEVWLIKLAPESSTDVRIYDNQISSNYSLCQNYPNPFNPSTTIKYQIPVQDRNDKLFVTLSGVEESFVTIKVYDILGSEVATLVNQKQKPGNYEVTWDATDVPSGVYFYKLVSGNPESSSGQVFVEVKKMILLK